MQKENSGKSSGGTKVLKEITFSVLSEPQTFGKSKRGIAEQLVFGELSVEIYKSLEVLGERIGMNRSVELRIPKDLQKDFIELWEKVSDNL